MGIKNGQREETEGIKKEQIGDTIETELSLIEHNDERGNKVVMS